MSELIAIIAIVIGFIVGALVMSRPKRKRKRKPKSVFMKLVDEVADSYSTRNYPHYFKSCRAEDMRKIMQSGYASAEEWIIEKAGNEVSDQYREYIRGEFEKLSGDD